jgi:hypothetical protein
MAMVGVAIFAIVLAILVVGPLALRAWHERMRERGLAIRADIDAVMRHELHGDSLLGVQVVAETPWRAGRVEVSVPEGWDPVSSGCRSPSWRISRPATSSWCNIPAPRACARPPDGRRDNPAIGLPGHGRRFLSSGRKPAF